MMSKRIGFFICHCGVNIAGKVRVEEVSEFVRGLNNVVVARDYKFMCSDPGQDMIEKDITDLGLNRVVVASCSPRLHEKTFQSVCQRAGINPYFFQMASVREQVSWVTEDPDEATNKAKTLAAAAINRVNFHRGLESREVSVHPDVLVVGAGITGMQASLDIARAGYKVHLVEKQPSVGGHMLQFDKTFPTLDCAACIGTPTMVNVGQEANIDLLTYSEVEEVTGFIGNFDVKIRRNARYVKEGVCTGCGDCASVCPVTELSEWDVGLAKRKAIYRSFPQAVPITFAIEKMDRAPCGITCPAGINVQGYVQLIGQGKYKEAVELIMERLPLPGTLGRVCPHACEAECRRLEVDEAISIRDLKRFAADQVDLSQLPLPEIVEREEKLAIIGSGPAGLTAAYYLRLKGYQVTIIESLAALGGMLRVGIPDYRLPPEVLDNEINHILNLGVESRTGQALGVDFTLQDLEKEGFKAVFLGTGAHGGIKLNVPGEETFEGVLDAVDFLRETNLGERKLPGKRVVVVGGGNVAIDAVRMARRLGSEEATIVYRRSREEMPAYEEEVEAALAEGVKIHYLTAPVRIQGAEGRVTGFECIKTELGSPDASGRRRPVPVEGSEFVIECDAVMMAIGQRPELGWAGDEPGLKISKWGTLEVNPHTMQTDIPHVFAAGDAVTGPATVIEAVAAGHKAVEAIDRYINGEDLGAYAEELKTVSPPGRDWREIPEGLEKEDRAHPTFRDPGESAASFDPVDLGFSEDEAQREALRCLNCGLCSECMACVDVCEAKAIDHSMEEEALDVKIGSIILATGYDLLDPTPMKPFGYGSFPNVFTSLEFERLNNATGPTSGQILMKNQTGEFTTPPESVAIIHCIGSRDENYHEYCSRVCCMYALKYGHLLKDKVGHHVKVYDYYIDMRCFGKGYEEFYKRCQEEGINFVRGKPAEITDQAMAPDEEGKLIVIGEDTLIGKRYRNPVDMVILCAAMEARNDAKEVGRIFGVNQGADGFFLEEHPKLGPLNTATDGVFIAGACQGPKDIPDAVAQASGAAAKALQLASRGTVEVSSTISWIDPDVCSGCQACINLCADSAIEFDERRGISVINEALCKGCGSCSGHCPSGAAQVRHFNERQIFAELDGIMDAIAAVAA
jgi:heterodisulfide reductase subunit A